jgi:hypothetical protein
MIIDTYLVDLSMGGHILICMHSLESSCVIRDLSSKLPSWIVYLSLVYIWHLWCFLSKVWTNEISVVWRTCCLMSIKPRHMSVCSRNTLSQLQPRIGKTVRVLFVFKGISAEVIGEMWGIHYHWVFIQCRLNIWLLSSILVSHVQGTSRVFFLRYLLNFRIGSRRTWSNIAWWNQSWFVHSLNFS